MHEVKRLWVRPVERGPVEERDAIRAVAGSGVEGDHTFGGRRHLTLVFEEDWARATAALGRDVSPAARRANVLLSGGGGAALVGGAIRIGEVELEVMGITAPCSRMDEAAEGLREALEPDRAGVWGVVRAGGTIRPGDRLAPA